MAVRARYTGGLFPFRSGRVLQAEKGGAMALRLMPKRCMGILVAFLAESRSFGLGILLRDASRVAEVATRTIREERLAMHVRLFERVGMRHRLVALGAGNASVASAEVLAMAVFAGGGVLLEGLPMLFRGHEGLRMRVIGLECVPLFGALQFSRVGTLFRRHALVASGKANESQHKP